MHFVPLLRLPILSLSSSYKRMSTSICSAIVSRTGHQCNSRTTKIAGCDHSFCFMHQPRTFRCNAHTKSGAQCKNSPAQGSDRCHIHQIVSVESKTCCATTTRGNQCKNPVSKKDGDDNTRCFSHQLIESDDSDLESDLI